MRLPLRLLYTMAVILAVLTTLFVILKMALKISDLLASSSTSQTKDESGSEDRGGSSALHDAEGMTGRIAYICNGDIYGMNLDTGEVTRRSHGANYLRLDWSPDGEKILYEKLSSGRLEFFVVNADGTGRQRLASVRSSAEDWNRIHNLLWLS